MLALLAVVLLGQYDDATTDGPRPKPFPPTKIMEARIAEAINQAQQWAMMEAQHLYPIKVLYNPHIPAERRKRLIMLQQEAKYDLKQAAYRQICEAYEIDSRTFNRIMHDPYVRLTPFTKEPLPGDPPPGTIRMATSPSWKRPTRFDPAKVRLSPKLARRHGYQNPEVQKNSSSTSGVKGP